ncbi:MAG: hypothetical protein LBP96_05285, partial [Bacteroidales bacterium]|nr:hypothetical protein [Bacteroidales bacterium]
MKKFNHRLHVLENRPISPDVFILTLGWDLDCRVEQIRPGQFAGLLVEPANGTFLRRPFSIHDVDFAQRTIKF